MDYTTALNNFFNSLKKNKDYIRYEELIDNEFNLTDSEREELEMITDRLDYLRDMFEGETTEYNERYD